MFQNFNQFLEYLTYPLAKTIIWEMLNPIKILSHANRTV